MFLLNGNPLSVDIAFTHNDIQYPANWLRLASLEEKQAIGITEVADPAVFDGRFYWAAGLPKDLGECKKQSIILAKTTANTLLAPTDWKVVRQAEIGTPVDTATLAYRAAVRAASNAAETAINATTTVDQLAALNFVWPEAT